MLLLKKIFFFRTKNLLSGHFVAVRCHFVVVRRNFVAVRRSFVVVSYSFVAVRYSFVAVRHSFVAVRRSFVVVRYSFVALRHSFVVVSYSFVVIFLLKIGVFAHRKLNFDTEKANHFKDFFIKRLLYLCLNIELALVWAIFVVQIIAYQFMISHLAPILNS